MTSDHCMILCLYIITSDSIKHPSDGQLLKCFSYSEIFNLVIYNSIVLYKSINWQKQGRHQNKEVNNKLASESSSMTWLYIKLLILSEDN